jgi:hypothetical protein
MTDNNKQNKTNKQRLLHVQSARARLADARDALLTRIGARRVAADLRT